MQRLRPLGKNLERRTRSIVDHPNSCRPPSLLRLCWCIRNHGCHTFWIDVEGQEGEGLVAEVPPLVDEAKRFIDKGTGSLRIDPAVNSVRSGSRDDIVQSRSRPM